MDFSGINYFAVVVAALAAFILGSLWYSPLLFGNSWQKTLGFTKEYIKNANMVFIFCFSFILLLIMALGLSMLFNVGGSKNLSWYSGMIHGFFVGLFFVGTSYGINLLYQRRTFKLWLIDAGYQIIFLGLMGAIIEAW